jgi:hypothetical protein
MIQPTSNTKKIHQVKILTLSSLQEGSNRWGRAHSIVNVPEPCFCRNKFKTRISRDHFFYQLS